MLKSKINAAIALKELKKISGHIGDIQSFFIDEKNEGLDDKEFLLASGKILADILSDIYYPIVEIHPSLRPVEMLGKGFESATYKAIKCNVDTLTCSVVKTAIIPDESANVLKEIESDCSNNQYLFWLELEDK